MRTLRTIVTRADPDLREIRLVGAIGYEIGHYLDRSRGENDGDAADSNLVAEPEKAQS